MKKRLLLPVLLLAALLCVMFTTPDSSTAVPQWIDDFNDDDVDDWTIYHGGISLENNRLDPSGAIQNWFSHESTNAYGVWSFDIYSFDTYNHGGWEVFFIALDVDNLNYPSNGYYLRTERAEYQLVRMENNARHIVDGYKNTTLGHDQRSIYEMMHVEIVRQYDGYLYVWLNRTTNGIFFDNAPIIENTFTTSTYFFISFWHSGFQWMDNIYVDNNPDNGPDSIPFPQNTELPTVPPEVILVTPWAIGLGVVVGGFLVWRRRQKKVKITPGEEITDE